MKHSEMNTCFIQGSYTSFCISFKHFEDFLALKLEHLLVGSIMIPVVLFTPHVLAEQTKFYRYQAEILYFFITSIQNFSLKNKILFFNFFTKFMDLLNMTNRVTFNMEVKIHKFIRRLNEGCFIFQAKALVTCHYGLMI